MEKDVRKVPDDYAGMWIDGDGRQWWVLGKGYYRKWKGWVIFHRGKRVGHFDDVKEKLRKVLKD